MRIVVVGGVRYIGSHAVRLLLWAGHKVQVFDNLLYGHSGAVPASVLDLIAAARRVTGHSIPTLDRPRRPGDQPALVASAETIQRDLGWSPRYIDLGAIVGSAWQWHSRHPQGYDERR